MLRYIIGAIIFAYSFLSSVSAEAPGGGPFTNAKFSFYQPDVGLGSCGVTSSNDSPTVALNEAQYLEIGDPCNMEVTITYNGKTVDATIMDKCPGCPHGGLDLSEGLFAQLENLDVGIIYGEWNFKDGSGGQGPTEPTSVEVPEQPTDSASVEVPEQPTGSIPDTPEQPTVSIPEAPGETEFNPQTTTIAGNNCNCPY